MNGEDEVVAWFKDQLLPEILREGHLPTGKNPKVVNCRFESTERFTDHFASSPYFLQLTVDSDDGRKVLDLLVKFSSQDDRIIKLMNLEKQFQNEVVVYGSLLKEFRELLLKNPKAPRDLIDQLIPKCYYSRYDKENLKKSLILFANQRTLGFKAADSLLFLDYDHCVVAMKQLGQFHALSLSMKIRYPELLNKMRDLLIEARYFEEPANIEQCNVFNGICNQRGVDYLLSQNPAKVPKDYLLAMKDMLSKPFDLFSRMVSPKEPLSLICHGDFCRNNLMFRYDGTRVADAKMFDFQTTRYATPGIDLAFFIYLNTNQQLRDEHFDELLTTYHTSLISTTAVILDVPENDVSSRYPFRLFAEDFAEHAVYGYSLAAFFISAMGANGNIDWDDTQENRARYFNTVGGDQTSQSIADIILDFYKRGFYVS